MRHRLVVDTNAYISAALSPKGPSSEIIRHAQKGEIDLILSDHLCDELSTRLERDKFRRWLTLDEAEDFVAALVLISTMVDDRPDAEIPLVCEDPDDNFLVALYQDADAQMLVSGDKLVRKIEYPGVSIYSPREALDALAFEHPWGDGFLTGAQSEVDRQIAAEGASSILGAYSAFVAVLHEPNTTELLPYVVVPEALPYFVRDLASIRDSISNRGLTTRPVYASPDVAYIKLPPDPEVLLRAGGPIALPQDTIFATMQLCPDLPDLPGTNMGHWRVFGIGSTVPPEQIRPRPAARP
ncbi:putative toxin-antitoxin system toxin component, PIN family [Rhodococcus erythropolis]|nr:putative toxin-antitoxin system toxin component, PIN family [Rhodococcus erythropolis]